MVKFLQMQIAEKQQAFIQAFCSCNFIRAFVLFTFFIVFLSFAEQFMEFDENDSGDIGKLSSWLHDERLLHRYWFAN